MASVMETAVAFDNNSLPEGTEMRFMVLSASDDRVLAIAADPENPTNQERTWVKVGYVVQRSDGRVAEKRWSELRPAFDGARYPARSAGFGADLKEIYDVEQSAPEVNL